MSLISRLDRHSRLVSRMADALGVDMEESMMRGELRPEELRSAVFRCTGCINPSDCEKRLDCQQVSDATPDYCRNKSLMESLIG